MKRQFKIVESERYVLSAINKFHCYHLECAPENSVEKWCSTRKTCCAKCGQPLYKQGKEENNHDEIRNKS